MKSSFLSAFVRTFALAGLAALTACTDTPSEPLLAAAPGALAFNTDPAASGVREEEREFFELAQEIPGFGGYAVDEEGNVVAHVKDLTPAKEGRARGRLDAIARAHGEGRRGGGRVIVKPAQFTFPEMAHWRDQLTDELLGKGLGVRSTDADEARNRVVVGVSAGAAGGAARQAIMQKVRDLRIPPGLVEIVEEDALAYEGDDLIPSIADPGYLTSVSNTYDASRGGLPLYYSSGGVKSCTIGFYATKNGVKVGVSNSHCSQDRNSGGGDGTPYYASYTTLGLQNYLGAETYDRGFHDYCGRWYNPLRWCRHADAQHYTVHAQAPATAVGFIARPLYLNPGNSDAAVYKQINSSNPSFRVNSRNNTRSGETINKVGARTGWTQGTVTATCKDVDMAVLVILPQPVMKCQHEASYARDRGDSGAPVFVIDWAGNADLRGIHWGHYPQMTGMKTVFSPLSGIERDLGAMHVLAPYAPPPPPPYSVTIGGNTWPFEFSQDTYTANVVSGFGPYTYQWYKDGDFVGTGPSVSLWIGSASFGLDVEVVDTATGETAYGSTWITPRPNCPDDPWGGPKDACLVY